MVSSKVLRGFGRVSLVGVAVSAVMLATPLAADNWPSWRGPSSGGVSAEKGLPEKWSSTENVAWKTKLGGVGVSSPIVWGDRVFVTSQVGTGQSRLGPRLGQGADTDRSERSLSGAGAGTDRTLSFVIEAFGRTDGRQLWGYTVVSDGQLPSVHDKHNLASASPVTDGERVYAVFGSGQIVAVDMNGKPVWTRHLGQDFAPFDINWGNGSSPIVYRNSVIITCYHQSSSYLIALDSRTGKQLWKTDRPRGVVSYSTPLVVPAPQGDELIVNSSVGVEAYDAASG